MASLQYRCNFKGCGMVLDDSEIEPHISAQHLAYFPFECAWCKEQNQKHYFASKADMIRHMSRNHSGKNLCYSVCEDYAKELELKKLCEECRRLVVPSGSSTANGVENVPDLTQVERENVITIEDDIEAAAMPNYSSYGKISEESPEVFFIETKPLIPPVSSKRPPVITETDLSMQYPIAVPTTQTESPANVSAAPVELTLRAALSYLVPIDGDADEGHHNSVAIPGNSSASSRKRKVSPNDLQSAGPTTDVRALPRQCESSQSSGYLGRGEQNDQDQAVSNKNDRYRNPATSAQVLLDIPCAQNMTIKTIWIDIGNGTASFETSESRKYPSRPLSEYLSILQHSEADAGGCKADIAFGQAIDATSVIARCQTFEKFSQEVRSICRLWDNGDVVAVLRKYSECENEILPLSDICDEFFSRDRSILASKALKLHLDTCWPTSVITNVAHRCKQLTLKDTATCYQDHRLHHSFLDIMYGMELPPSVEVAFVIEFPQATIDFVSELKKRFRLSNGQHFEFMLLSPRIVKEQLRNEHGTLQMKTIPSQTGRFNRATIEQRCCASDPRVKSVVLFPRANRIE